MSKISDWGKAQADRASAEEYIGLIGKTTTRSTVADRHGVSETAGHLNSLKVATDIYFQPYDGAKNYHECKAFDRALTEAIRAKWSDLCADALDRLRHQEREAAASAKGEVEAQLERVNSAIEQLA